MYLLENGRAMFLWVGRLAAPSWIQQVLGVSSFQAIDAQSTQLPVIANALSVRVRAILATLESQRIPFMSLHIIKQKDPNELTFHQYLVEDKINDTMSYVDFICFVHKEIQSTA